MKYAYCRFMDSPGKTAEPTTTAVAYSVFMSETNLQAGTQSLLKHLQC